MPGQQQGPAAANGLNSIRRGRVEQDCLVEVQSKHLALPDTNVGIRPHPRGNPLPAIEVTTNVSDPAGSTISTSLVNVVTLFDFAFTLSGSLTASGRMPKMTLAPSLSFSTLALVGAGNAIGTVPARSMTTEAAPFDRETLPSTRFIDGEPMKSATNRFAGVL